jgi:hypothetical protein
MPKANDTARWVLGLADPDPSKRRAAATEIYHAASVLCQPIVNSWTDHVGFRGLLRRAEGLAPANTENPDTPLVAGIAVLPETFEKIRAANGSPRLADVPPDQDAIEFELQFGEHVDLDILTSREPRGSGAIARYLQKFGEGIQQVEIYVTHLDRATEILRTQFNLTPIYPAARRGADGTNVNFFLAAAPNKGKKVLIEIVEAADRKL